MIEPVNILRLWYVPPALLLAIILGVILETILTEPEADYSKILAALRRRRRGIG